MARTSDAISAPATAQPPSLKVSRVFQASREAVFKAWSSADHVKRWFCPETYTIPDAVVRFETGGVFDVCMRSPAGVEHWSRGRVVEVVPLSRLVIDFHANDSAGKTLFRAYTEVNFSDEPDGTRIDVTQTYTFIDAAMAAPMIAGAQEGWRTTLDKLANEVALITSGARTGSRSVVHAIFHLERSYDARVARVWRALTDEAGKRKWFAGPPENWEELERHMDVRAGGSERLKVRWHGGVHAGAVTTFDASYFDVIPNERLVYSYEMHIDDRKISVSLATLQLVGVGQKTTLKVTEQGAFLDGYDDAGSREQGTGHLLDALGRSLLE